MRPSFFRGSQDHCGCRVRPLCRALSSGCLELHAVPQAVGQLCEAFQQAREHTMNLSAGNLPTKTAATAGCARKTVQRGHSLPPAFRGSSGYGPGCAHRFSHKLIEYLTVGLVEKRGPNCVRAANMGAERGKLPPMAGKLPPNSTSHCRGNEGAEVLVFSHSSIEPSARATGEHCGRTCTRRSGIWLTQVHNWSRSPTCMQNTTRLLLKGQYTSSILPPVFMLNATASF